MIAELNRSARSDSAGNFTMLAIAAGPHRVTVRAPGHEPLQETVTFGATDRIERDYLLAHVATTLGPVEVRAEASVALVRAAARSGRGDLGGGGVAALRARAAPWRHYPR